MSESLKQIGEQFRRRREEMNLTYKEVENATSIRTMYLQAIEEGKVALVLSTVYAMGFIRQYATFLGFDVERLMKEHPEAFRLTAEKQDFAYGIGTLEARGTPSGGISWVPTVLWGSAIVLLGACAWFLAKALGIF